MSIPTFFHELTISDRGASHTSAGTDSAARRRARAVEAEAAVRDELAAEAVAFDAATRALDHHIRRLRGM